MNVLLTTEADGSVTVHRDTCKKIEDHDSIRVEDQIENDPQKLVTAKKATCCKPSPATLSSVEQAGWDALEKATDEEATDEETTDEDLIGGTDEDLIGDVKPAPKKPTATKVAKELAAAKEINGTEALQKVAEYLGLDLGPKPKFPGFGRAFKATTKQSVYVNSKGSADARALNSEQAAEWAALEHVERRAGNYVRVSFGNL